MSNNLSNKTPPAAPGKSVQFDLFNQFIANDHATVSNAIELWESIPKYFFTAKQIKNLRTKNGLANPFKWEFMRNSVPCSVVFQPALIEQKDGRYLAFFPGPTEELVEEILKKISADGKRGMHDSSNAETWVTFTLKLIQKELKEAHRSRSITEIKQAIEVMSSCILTYSENGKEVWKGTILQDLVTVGRDDYLADSSAQHVARLPLFISLGINRLQFRQFNYPKYMSCDGQLTRWINRRLVHRYKQASMTNSYHFMFSDLKNSGLLQQIHDRKNRAKTEDALNELIKVGTIARWEKHEQKEQRTVVDVKYTVYPTSSFVSEQKAANKRATDQGMLALNQGADLNDTPCG